MAGHMSVPVFVPHVGCPHDCVFCNQRHITGVEEGVFDEVKIRRDIEAYLSTAGDRKVEIAFFGGSFTGIPWPIQKKYLDLAATYMDKGQASGIRFSTRPDYINAQVMERLRDYPVRAIELGVQSLDPVVLTQSNRGHSAEDAARACTVIKEAGIELGVQMMLGLPGDTFRKSLQTLQTLIELEPDTLRIYPTLVFEGTVLAELYKRGWYKPLTVEEAVDWSKKLVPIVERAGVRLIRLGLHNTETLAQDDKLLSGPYHPAFGQLVYDGLAQDRVIERFRSLHNPGNCAIKAGRKMYQRLIGYRREGLARLESEGLPKPELDTGLDDEQFLIVKEETI